MAAKRITNINIDWTALADRVPEAQRPLLAAFKAKSDGYLRRMIANPQQPPKIDWSYYTSRVPVKGMVADFQKQYDALAIPYPKDTYTSLIDAQEKEALKEIAEFVKASNARIASYEEEVKRLKSLVPFENMTMEEFFQAYPEQGFDPKKPTFWPHIPEEQPGYKGGPEAPAH
ncbi:hypothetical protein R5R35_003071 [Gryllus longicercus]|uniref:ATP synthase subunit d, mitochondrial n=1 Tax=Gryllus longicercus TaxID=2509291 RepID=A0AAN9V4V9_9ORTH